MAFVSIFFALSALPALPRKRKELTSRVALALLLSGFLEGGSSLSSLFHSLYPMSYGKSSRRSVAGLILLYLGIKYTETKLKYCDVSSYSHATFASFAVVVAFHCYVKVKLELLKALVLSAFYTNE